MSTPQDPHSSTGEVKPHTGAGNVEDSSETSSSATATGPSVSGTLSNVLPIFTFQGETVTAGGAVTFGGDAVSRFQNHDGVLIDHDRTVLLSDGEATTLSQQESQKPLTISRSGSIFIVNGQTIPGDQEVTAGQTMISASASGSSAILYINGTPVPTTSTADGRPLTSSRGMGDYINSGINGGSASESSDGSAATAADGAVTTSTGDGSRTSMFGWSCGDWLKGLLAFVGVICSL